MRRLNTIQLWYTTGKNLRTSCYGEQRAVHERIEEIGAFTINLILTWTSKLITLLSLQTRLTHARVHTAGARQFAVNRKVALTSSRELRHNWLQWLHVKDTLFVIRMINFPHYTLHRAFVIMHYSVRCGHRGPRSMPMVARLCLCLCFGIDPPAMYLCMYLFSHRATICN